jgi:uncharacterized hydrophobic protein (TIGR00271 family)
MTRNQAEIEGRGPNRVIGEILGHLSLLADKADDADIDASLRGGAELRGSTPWILIFAIFIASIGLNVNSTAVIIGAMLISPLMGPIMGVGYGVAIYDFALIRKSLVNLGAATFIGLLTSTVYFLVSPLAEAQSELLARTRPTIWDVLVALFGGFAGVIGATRKEKSNVIPGVAIATALMPPLCTAGYGLAKGDWGFFGGAAYLFAINSVFIAFATVTIISILDPPNRAVVDPVLETRVRRAVFSIVLIVGLPSVYLAQSLVREAVFGSRARAFLRTEFAFPRSHITDLHISGPDRAIELTVFGDPIPAATIRNIEGRLAGAGLGGARLIVRQAGAEIDVASLRAGIVHDLFQEGRKSSDQKDEQIRQLEAAITRVDSERVLFRAIAAELKAQYPQLDRIAVAKADVPEPGQDHAESPTLLVSAESPRTLSRADTKKVEDWLRVRSATPLVRLMIQTGDIPPALRIPNRGAPKD